MTPSQTLVVPTLVLMQWNLMPLGFIIGTIWCLVKLRNRHGR